MSVIFGIDECDKVYVCGDRRASTIEGKIINDNLQKVVEINPSLAFASAGNAAIGKAIETDIANSGKKEYLTVDGLIDIIKNFYNKVRDNNAVSILMLPFYCLVAGKTIDESDNLMAIMCKNGNLSYKATPMALFPPAGADHEQCNSIFKRNYIFNRNTFCENTVREIAGISNAVSPTGNKWIYNKITGIGTMFTF